MKKVFKQLLLVIAAWFAVAPMWVAASDKGTADDAVAMVKKAVTYFKANGKEKLLSAVPDSKGPFIDRDLYVSVWDLKGMVLAHGANPKLVGKDVSLLKDGNDKPFIKEILAKAAKEGKGWEDYVWVNPVTKELQNKSAYFEKTGDVIISVGYYK